MRIENTKSNILISHNITAFESTKSTIYNNKKIYLKLY